MSPHGVFVVVLWIVLAVGAIGGRTCYAQEPNSPAEAPIPPAAQEQAPAPAEPSVPPTSEEAAAPAAEAVSPAPVTPTPPVSEPASRAAERVVPLGLCEVVARALSSNLDIAIERYIPDIRDAELLSTKGEFDPLLSIDYSYSESEIPQTSLEGISTGAATTETHLNEVSGAVSGRLISGTEYELVFDRRFSQFIRHDAFDGAGLSTIEDPWQYDLDTYVSVTQPLLRDFGLAANLAGIRIARVQRDVSLEDFRQSVIDIVAEVQRAYWRLVLAIENLRVAETSLGLAQDLLRQNRIRLQVGAMSPLEVIEAEAGVAQREEEVIIASSLIKAAEDNLKRLLNLPRNTEEWNVVIVPTDKPVILDREFDTSSMVQTAIANRPDYKSALMQIKSTDINVQFTRNQMLPAVDVIGQYEFRAVDENVSDALDDITAGESPSWVAGVTAEYPIGNRLARGNHQAAQLEKLQSDLAAENLRLAIVVQVRQAIRGIETSLKSIEASQKTTEFASRSLDAEQKKLAVGISTSYDVLQFVDALTDAQRREVVARVTYRIALIDLAAATGTILEENKIIINENL